MGGFFSRTRKQTHTNPRTIRQTIGRAIAPRQLRELENKINSLESELQELEERENEQNNNIRDLTIGQKNFYEGKRNTMMNWRSRLSRRIRSTHRGGKTRKLRK